MQPGFYGVLSGSKVNTGLFLARELKTLSEGEHLRNTFSPSVAWKSVGQLLIVSAQRTLLLKDILAKTVVQFKSTTLPTIDDGSNCDWWMIVLLYWIVLIIFLVRKASWSREIMIPKSLTSSVTTTLYGKLKTLTMIRCTVIATELLRNTGNLMSMYKKIKNKIRLAQTTTMSASNFPANW